MFTNENLHTIYKQKLSLLSRNALIVLILDDENNYYIFKTVKILLFNNEINNTNTTIFSFNYLHHTHYALR